MSAFVSVVATLVIGGVLVWYAFHVEPHWASKDGRRCICRGQQIDHHGQVQDRWREYRAEVLEDGDVSVRRRSFAARSQGGLFRVVSRSADEPKRRAVFVLRGRDNPDSFIVLRLPSSSAAVPVLDAIASP